MESSSVITGTGIKSIVGDNLATNKENFDQPKVFFVFCFEGSEKLVQGISSTQPVSSEVIYSNRLEWRYKLSLHNNSEYPASNITLISPLQGNSFRFNPPINSSGPNFT